MIQRAAQRCEIPADGMASDALLLAILDKAIHQRLAQVRRDNPLSEQPESSLLEEEFQPVLDRDRVAGGVSQRRDVLALPLVQYVCNQRFRQRERRWGDDGGAGEAFSGSG